MSDFCAPYIPAELAPRVGAAATRTTNLSIPNSTITAVTWPNETFDTHLYFTPGGSVFTVPSGKAGIYVITAKVSLATSGTLLRIVAGGLTYDFSGSIPFGNPAGSISVPLAVGDTVVVSAYQTSGAPVNVTAGNVFLFLLGL